MTTAKLEDVAARVGSHAQALLDATGHKDVGHIVILVGNCAEGGSDQVTATNVEPADAAEVLRFIASQLSRPDVKPVREVES